MNITKDTFPLDRIPDIQKTPENFRLLLRLESFTGRLCPRVGDEKPLLILDLETTGFNRSDKIIEFGFVRCSYSPSEKKLPSVDGVASLYNDPGCDISDFITGLTGIKTGDVKGQHVTRNDLDTWTFGAPLVVAHNAGFDCPFFYEFDSTLPMMNWVCSAEDIDWKSMGMSSKCLEYLCFKHGFFYEAHRASIDCMAVCRLLQLNQPAFEQLLDKSEWEWSTIFARDSPFSSKDTLKARGYNWIGGVWQKNIARHDVEAEKKFLGELYPAGGQLAQVRDIHKSVRYRKRKR